LVIGQIKNGWSGQHEVLKGWRTSRRCWPSDERGDEPFLRGCSVILIFIFSQDSYVPNVPYVV